MKEIGVVRKIDELGRVVIPKEIRKTLGIKDGENLEIFVDKNSICLKKYSSLLPLSEWASFVVEMVKKELCLSIVVLDTDKIISSFNESLIGKSYPNYFIDKLENREKYESFEKEEIVEGLNGYYYFIPLIIEGDLLGSVFLFSDEGIKEYQRNFLNFLSHILMKDIS